jgi:ATP-binding cassette, subfamily C, bacterial CydCD
MKPLDPRLVRYATRARAPLAAVVALGVGQAVLVIAQAFALADVIVEPIRHGVTLHAVAVPLLALAGIGLARGCLTWLTDVLAQRAGVRVTEQLRGRLLQHCLDLGPSWLSGVRRGELTALLTRGVSALEPYVARYLPTLALAAIVPPLSIAVIAYQDSWSAVIIAVTLPLIPVFGALVGWATQRRSERQWRSMATLAGHFADVTAGLPTLVAYRRARSQSERIREVTRKHAEASMATLRLAFASSAVLELVATISVAMIAVSVGLRLIDSAIDFRTALVVLLLAPEAYWPLRRVGAEFHASTEGLAAMSQVAAVLETPVPGRGARTDVPDLRTAVIEVHDLVVRYPDRSTPALGPVSFTLRPSTLHALTGPSGCGKSTVLAALLGFAPVESGAITVDGADLAEFDPDRLRAQLAWLPQHPATPAGTLADSVRLMRPDATDEQLRGALDEVGLSQVIARLPDGLDTVLAGPSADSADFAAAGLSAGERARLALARVLVAERPVVLLDEPSARLDAATEQTIVEVVQRLRRNTTVLMVTHRAGTAAAADVHIELAPPAAAPSSAPVRCPVGSVA